MVYKDCCHFRASNNSQPERKNDNYECLCDKGCTTPFAPGGLDCPQRCEHHRAPQDEDTQRTSFEAVESPFEAAA